MIRLVSRIGASQIIAWVLLLGLGVSLATMVFLWTTSQTEDMSESAIRFVEGNMECDNVMINVKSNSGTNNCTFTVSNTHYLNISKLIIRRVDINNPVQFECNNSDQPLGVKEQVICDQTESLEGNFSIIPIIKIKDNFIGCKNKVIKTECYQ